MSTLLLAVLLQPSGPVPTAEDRYLPPDPVLPIPAEGTRPPDESTSPFRRTYLDGAVEVRFGREPRWYLPLGQTDYTRTSAALAGDGVGLRCEAHLGGSLTATVEARTFLFTGTARVGFVYFPSQGGALPIAIDLTRGRFIGPDYCEAAESAYTVGWVYLAFSEELRTVLNAFLKPRR